MRVVIDHVAGSRRGQRQELPADARVRFGRHPECEVSFDPHRDIDASSRHAELRPPARPGAEWVLVDLGSSNGTYAEGRRVTEAPVAAGQPMQLEFGVGGPRVRLFIGETPEIEALPPATVERRRPPWLWPVVGAGALLLVVLLLAIRC
ncbi:MAG TPA: FHA domain-containing protein [Kofleriaceae bacterium]